MTTDEQSLEEERAEVEAEAERLIGPADRADDDVHAYEYPAWT